MLHRVKKENDMHEGKWNGIGGKFLPGETPEECVIREVYEETGLTIKNPKLKGRIAFWNPAPDSKNTMQVYLFEVTQFSGKLIDSPEGHLKWIPDRDLSKLNRWDADEIFMPWLKKDKFFSGKFVYNGTKVAEYKVHFY